MFSRKHKKQQANINSFFQAKINSYKIQSTAAFSVLPVFTVARYYLIVLPRVLQRGSSASTRAVCHVSSAFLYTYVAQVAFHLRGQILMVASDHVIIYTLYKLILHGICMLLLLSFPLYVVAEVASYYILV